MCSIASVWENMDVSSKFDCLASLWIPQEYAQEQKYS